MTISHSEVGDSIAAELSFFTDKSRAQTAVTISRSMNLLDKRIHRETTVYLRGLIRTFICADLREDIEQESDDDTE
jgi:hypothetical protein